MIGDYVIITPAITALKNAFPNAKIAIFIKEMTKSLVETNPDIDEIILDPNQIKKGSFDLAIDFYGDPKYARLIYLCRIPYRIGDCSRILNCLFYNVRVFINWRDFTKHYLEHYLELLRPLGIEVKDPKINIRPAKSAEESVKKLLPSGKYIGLHIGTGGSNRSWTSKNFAKTAELIMEKLGLQVVLLGGKKEEAKAKEIMNLSNPKPINLVNKISLPELAAVLSKLAVYVGSDTGPFHLAAGLGIPIVALMPTKFVKPTQWGPWNTRNIVLRPNSPCDKACNPRSCKDSTCLIKISPDEVLSAIQSLMAGGGNNTLEESKKDWIKKSLNILLIGKDLKNLEKASSLLFNDDYRACSIKNASLRKLLSIFVKEDINILHSLDSGPNFKLRLACLLSSIKLLLPVLFIKTTQAFNQSSEIIDIYLKTLCRKFH